MPLRRARFGTTESSQLIDGPLELRVYAMNRFTAHIPYARYHPRIIRVGWLTSSWYIISVRRVQKKEESGTLTYSRSDESS
ncbi:hypothetical protein EVAR_44785_1 [Eumeta japonica]|uniref:Uncharacterized protein n=1 Tax=Eumeta variegata TaxID=151549 RepID=A0A4C1YA51_EUMVA|nr:hypothetical protein EVAR_44785_1 [Eumeta japonica]